MVRVRKSTIQVTAEEAAARTGLADDGDATAWLLHTPHASAVDLSTCAGPRAVIDFSGFVLTERGVI